MEIKGVDKIQSVKKLERNAVVQSARIEDSLSISTEAQKKAEWVEMLKEMPDIREDKIQEALASDATANPYIAYAQVAKQLISS